MTGDLFWRLGLLQPLCDKAGQFWIAMQLADTPASLAGRQRDR